ncbi:LytR/AlgR family response regulator transcription factor [Aegicerativicinus sediminis]|uniref:LytR/AlgR family response regulator transcription factor n=1 Tax=Aegicerativicinus sediminis TaxID=2893202 RepID=UPI001E41CF65|nr:LytTR family DNA-binding domain-containing protein [Aegicerativicinus sediminis]
MKAIIIEDEKPSARRLQRMLQTIGLEVVCLLHSVEEAGKWFDENAHPDLIMLDIQLSDGLSFDIFEGRSINSHIIFTTAFDEYALRAFKLNSIDYLLKPIEEAELQAAIEKFKALRNQFKTSSLNLEQIKSLLVGGKEKEYKKRFTVKIGQHIKLVDADSIECIYSENKGTYLYTNNKRSFLIDQTLDQLEGELDPSVFFRVNRTFYVNINAIVDIINYTNSRLRIKLNTYKDEEIIVARERVKNFREWL